MPHKDPEARREYERRYREANREKVREAYNRWRANPENRARENARKQQQRRADPVRAREQRDRANARERQRRQDDPQWAARQREKSRRYHAQNRERRNAGRREWRRANHEESLADNRIRGPKIRHGPDYEVVFAEMWERQHGRCYLCGDDLRSLPSANVHVDHDHRCCPPSRSCAYCRRGLACNNCNSLIGFARDDPDRLRRIVDNLELAVADVTRRLAGKHEQLTLDEASSG
jgi:Recombination endonuclease VII